FQVSFTLEQSTAQGQAQELPGLRISPLELPSETVQLDLVLHMVDAGPTLFGDWQYSTDLFDAQTIAGFAADFELLLEQVVEQPDAPLAELLARLEEAAGARRRAREQELEAARLSKLKQVRRKAVIVPGAAESGASRHE
ncbi:MAG TPA: condensation domain-containing protein, partial [Pyrinomonadaceae bacterium]|nr:condensation domain-containing protein [Pyrinomonadaceae bacterium]